MADNDYYTTDTTYNIRVRNDTSSTVMLGYSAGANTSGSNNIAIGRGSYTYGYDPYSKRRDKLKRLHKTLSEL